MSSSSGALPAFNSTCTEFIDELVKNYPDYPIIAEFQKDMPCMIEKDQRCLLTSFSKITSAAPIREIIHKNDWEQELMKIPDEELPFAGHGLNLKALLSSDNSTVENKKTMMQYVKTLAMFSTTISIIPDEMMSSIDKMAQEMSKKIESGEIDPKLILQNAQSMLMNNPLFSREGGLPTMPAAPRPGQRQRKRTRVKKR